MMGKARKMVSQFVGFVQCTLGGLSSVFAYLIYADQSVRDMFAVASGEVALYMFVLSVFGVLSVMSGAYLVRGENGGD